MPRPPVDTLVDADVCARAASTVERHFSGAELPRLAEVGARAESALDMSLRFSLFEDHPAIEGELQGAVVLTCQRCLQAVRIVLDERFQLLVVEQERADEPGGYEPVIADPGRLDVRWLAEDQALLALPLVPLHEPGECEEAPAPEVAEDAAVVQKPFQNLRDMLRQR